MRLILLKTVVAILILLAALTTGCGGTRTVYVRSGEVVRNREEIKNQKIWTVDKNGKEVPGTMTIPEGWFFGPDPDDKGEKPEVLDLEK